MPLSMPSARRAVLVTNKSSLTSWQRLPSFPVSSVQPSQSPSDTPSSIEMVG
jgi:hypothetical protein